MIKQYTRKYTGAITVFLTLLGYLLVIGSLYVPSFSVLYPEISAETVNVLSHVIAINNLAAMCCLIAGWWYIRKEDRQRHPFWMTAGFLLILLFLMLYLVKTGGGGRKEFIGPTGPKVLYLILLATHILLSIVSVPLVLYSFLLGWSHSISELPSTPHPDLGQYAAGTWIISLFLGLLAYLLLNHIYAFEFVAR